MVKTFAGQKLLQKLETTLIFDNNSDHPDLIKKL